jgi:hypothetical protein
MEKAGLRVAGLLGRVFGRWIAVSGIGLMVGACAVIEQASVDEAKATVSERAQQRWDFVMKNQMDKAYEYLSPASRTTMSLDLFRKRNAAGRWWRSLKLDKVDCSADTCQVTMALEYDLYDIKGLKATIEETWIKDAGTWWLVAGRK